LLGSCLHVLTLTSELYTSQESRSRRCCGVRRIEREEEEESIFSLEGFTLPETQLESVLQVLFMVSNSPLAGGKGRDECLRARTVRGRTVRWRSRRRVIASPDFLLSPSPLSLAAVPLGPKASKHVDAGQAPSARVSATPVLFCDCARPPAAREVFGLPRSPRGLSRLQPVAHPRLLPESEYAG
jgi:hypothetical protein